MQIIIRIVQYLIPFLIQFVNKYSDDFLEILFKRIKNVLEEGTVARIKFNVINKNGEPVNDAQVVFRMDLVGELTKKPVSEELSVSGFQKGTYDFIIRAKGYRDKIVSVEFKEDKSVIDKAVIMEEL